MLVTGGSRGIGHAVVRRLVSQGWSVAFTYRRDAQAAAALAGQLSAASAPGACVRAYELDLADARQAQALPGEVLRDFGRLDGLVNNAGLTDDGGFLSMASSRWERVLQSNFGGTAALTLAAVPLLLAAPAPAIVMLASLAGLTGKEGQVAYATSKGALVGMTQWLGRRYGPDGLRVNAVAPGFVRTEMVDALQPAMYRHILAGTALGRMGEADEVADAVAFLLAHGYLQSTTLRVDGGFKR